MIFLLLLVLAVAGCPGEHPPGYDDPAVHGLDLKLGASDCRACHGEDLRGGTSGWPCDACHDDRWRSDCTFCHGGADAPGGAPPRDLDGETTASRTSFPAHTAHVAGPRHPSYPCATCHAEPSDVLSPGHVLDDTPGRAEVALTTGSFADGACTGTCHGSEPVAVDAVVACGDCHAVAAADGALLSGKHDDHLREDTICADCHGDVDAAGAIVVDEQHADGIVSLAMPSTIDRSTNGRCTGSCHDRTHGNFPWRETPP